MRIERLLLSSSMLDRMGFSNFFNRVSLIEIIGMYRYDNNQFLSLERITFNGEHVESWESIMRQSFPVTFIHLISISGNTVTCFVRSTSSSGFFPIEIDHDGPWAIIPPITMDPRSIIFTLVADDNIIPLIHTELAKIDPSFRVLALNDLGKSLPRNS
ncbi:MAG: hypothetical protein ACTSXP_14920, partial [Promethearchaeota archaeon]